MAAIAGLVVHATVLPAATDTDARSLYFPGKDRVWAGATPESAGLTAAGIDAALDLAAQRRSSGLIVLHRGKIVVERYWPTRNEVSAPAVRSAPGDSQEVFARGDVHAGPKLDVASLQKSVVMLLIGIAQERGLLRIEDPVVRWIDSGWSRAPAASERAITIRHLLTMTSGLRDDLTWEAAAGTKWRYNTAAYAQLTRVLEAAAGKDLKQVTQAWLTEPIGMAETNWQDRSANNPNAAAVNRWGLRTTARDLARFGLLVLAGGEWRGQKILGDSRYVESALQPSQTLNPQYGYLWWLNREVTVTDPAMRYGHIPDAPVDLVLARGAREQRIYVVPSLHLVIVRIGDSAGSDFDHLFWRALLGVHGRTE